MTRQELDAIPVPADGFVVEQESEWMVLYHPVTGTELRCDELGVLIWRLCDGIRNVADIIALVSDAFPESADAIRSQVPEALERFASFGALSFSRSGSGPENTRNQ